MLLMVNEITNDFVHRKRHLKASKHVKYFLQASWNFRKKKITV